ncbi:MAG: TMEM175 family protein [Gemmatimonadetes bacterium]|nr:TMEM175 family protein [Gemmatimonadota bacterium]
MGKGRLEAFSDGVIAIIITIMVLELKVPAGHDLADLGPVLPVLLSYVLSFIYLGTYWNNHHHLLQVVHKVSGATLWANLHLLFWLSLIPFTTAWMGESHFSEMPVMVYGGVLLMCAIAYTILVKILLRNHGEDSHLAKAIGDDRKGKFSLVMYIAGILLAYSNGWVGLAMFAGVAVLWLIPDRRIEKQLSDGA